MTNLRAEIKALFYKHHVLTALEIRQFLAQKQMSYSLVAIYYELKLLTAQKMIIKEQKRYILSLAWVLDAQLSLEKVYRGLLNATYFQKTLIGQQEINGQRKQRWRFSSMYQMNEFWVQLIFLLAVQSRTRHVIEYVPRLWFAYIEADRDKQYQRNFEAKQLSIDIIVGGKAHLDTDPQRRRGNRPAYHCYYEPSPFHHFRNRCYCLMNDWLITIVMPRRLSRDMDNHFSKAHAVGHHELAGLWALLNRKETVSLCLERNTQSSRRISKRFETYLEKWRRRG